MYLYTKKEILYCSCLKVIAQTDRHTDSDTSRQTQLKSLPIHWLGLRLLASMYSLWNPDHTLNLLHLKSCCRKNSEIWWIRLYLKASLFSSTLCTSTHSLQQFIDSTLASNIRFPLFSKVPSGRIHCKNKYKEYFLWSFALHKDCFETVLLSWLRISF